jgi:hypothetical protein
MPGPISKPTLLLVEGKQDERFFQALLHHLKFDTVIVEGIDGVRQLPSVLKALKTRSGYYRHYPK